MVDARSRTNGDVINAPADIFEGGGDLVTFDREGRPLRADGTPLLSIEKTEQRDGWFAYAGRAPEGVDGPTRQQQSPLPPNQSSWAAFQPIFRGDLPPTLLTAARLPIPNKPLMVVEDADVMGFTATTDLQPDFLALTFGKGQPGSVRHSKLSPAVMIPKISHGQSIKALLFDQVSPGVTHIGIWKTAPGTSTRTNPGTFYMQREVDISDHNPGFWELTGPFRTDRPALSRNETVLATPGRVTLRFRRDNTASRPGEYNAFVVWTDEHGESLPGPMSGTVTINPDPYYQTYDDEGNVEPSIAGRGELVIERPPNPPPNATGWRAGVFVEGEDYVVYYSREALGNEQPLPLSWRYVETPGWSSAGDNEFSKNDTEFLVRRDRPTENTSGLEDPTDTPAEPIVFGANRPAAGTWHGFVTDSLRGKESLPSEAASVTITDAQTFRIVYQDEVNAVPNAENTEVDPDGLPLDQVTTIPETSPGVPSGTVKVVGKEVVMTTAAAGQSVAPDNATAWMYVSHDRDWRMRVEMSAQDPQEGIFSGYAEAVLQEKNAAGTITSTTLFTLNSPGRAHHRRTVFSSDTNLAGKPNAIKWSSSTRQGRILIRYGGATKNLTIRVGYRILGDGSHETRRLPVGPIYVGRFNPADTEAEPQPEPEPELETPPGGGSGPTDPPEVPPPPEPIPAAEPTLVVWPSPERPDSVGTLLEPVHDYETGMPPARWEQVVAGNATLTRETTGSLSGAGFLRSQKTVAGP